MAIELTRVADLDVTTGNCFGYGSGDGSGYG